MPSIASLPTETLLAIIDAATWCPGRNGPNPDLLAPLGLVCRAWYRLTRPLVYRDFAPAFLNNDLVCDALDGSNVFRHVRTLRFSPAITLPETEEMGHLRTRYRFEHEFEFEGVPSRLPPFLQYFNERSEFMRYGTHPAMEEVALDLFAEWLADMRRRWRTFLAACASTLQRLQVAAFSEVDGFDPKGRKEREWLQDVRCLRPDREFPALMSLDIVVLDEMDLDHYLDSSALFPNLEELRISFSANQDVDDEPTTRSPDTPLFANLKKLELKRTPKCHNRSRRRCGYVDVARLCHNFAWSAHTLVDLRIDLRPTIPKSYSPATCLSVRYLFDDDIVFPELRHLSLPKYDCTDTNLSRIFPCLVSAELAYFTFNDPRPPSTLLAPHPPTIERLDLRCCPFYVNSLPLLIPEHSRLTHVCLHWWRHGDFQLPDSLDSDLQRTRNFFERAGAECLGFLELEDGEDSEWLPDDEDDEDDEDEDELSGVTDDEIGDQGKTERSA